MQKYTRYFLFLAGMVFMSLLSPNRLSAQIHDSTIVVAHASDTAKDDSTPKKHHKMTKPDQAALMSAIVPGLGQIGHHDSWWHVPIIYAGFAALGYGIYFNNLYYVQYKGYFTQRLKYEKDTTQTRDPYWGYLSDDGLLANRDDYRRNRDLLIFISVGWYAANIIDAYVAAHLREFDISNNLSMRIDPVNFTMIGNQPAFTCGLKFNLK